MPLYEYQCDTCRGQFEELVLGEAQEVLCPACGSNQTSKLISACRFRSGGGGGGDYAAPSSGSSSGCAGCSGGSCSTCG